MPPTVMDKLFFQILTIEIDFPNGLTIGIGKLEPVTEGWVVKQKEAQNLEGREGLEKAFDAAVRTTRAISGYKLDDTELWDVVEIFEDEDEATIAGKLNGQMTIYQIETGRLKWLD